MTETSDLKASRRTILRAYALIIPSALASWWLWPSSPQITLGVGLAVSAGVAFALIVKLDNGSVFDAWWSVMPPLAALWMAFGVAEGGPLNARQTAVLVVTGFWGTRLTLNWWRDWPGLHHEDWRFGLLASRWPLPVWAVRLVAVIISQTFLVYVGLLPLHAAMTQGGPGLGVLDAIALIVGVGATTIELVADEQMKIFAERKAPGEVMDRGLWRLSRHPNYFGEIGFWVSLWLFALAATPSAWWTGVGALTITVMFVTFSIPTLDERSRERRAGFKDYASRTPALIPWPRRQGP
ncbi:MAG: hypothetical protein CMN75_01305 [Spirochaeta sp.]|nr:hypothetical protein [Spirochaeta sp.]RPG03087.1 MAG: DUF1295 domain-containing protein [Proteobacteria bacterium TMED72]